MSHTTKADQIIAALKQWKPGIIEIESRSSKYRVFVNSATPEQYYFVGKKGALRKGRCASKSYSLEHIVPQLLAKFPFKFSA